MKANAITISSSINASIQKVWEYWNNPDYIKEWAFAAATWHVPFAANDFKTGGFFSTTMAAKDGSVRFDFTGIYTEIIPNQLIAYEMPDGRKVKITFTEIGNKTLIIQSFDPEIQNPLEMQEAGWQAILNNFKKLVES